MELQPILWVIPVAGTRRDRLRPLPRLGRPSRRHRHGGDAGHRRDDPRGRGRLHPSPVPDHRACSPSAARWSSASSSPSSRARDVADTSIFGFDLGMAHRHRVPGRCGVLDGVRHHRHVHQREGEPAHGRGRAAQPGARGAGRHARRRRLRLPGRRAQPARRVRHLRRLRRVHEPAGGGAVPHRRLRLRRQLRGALRPARRRHLHQGGRRRRRPRRQGRGRHPRGRPAQRGRRGRPGGRQRRRLRRPWRRPVRVDRRREHRRHDPGRRGLRHRGRSSAGRTPRRGSSSRSSSAPSACWPRSWPCSSSAAARTRTR